MDIAQAAVESAISLATLRGEEIGIAIADNSGRCLISSRTIGAEWTFEHKARALAEVSAYSRLDSEAIRRQDPEWIRRNLTERGGEIYGGTSRLVGEWNSVLFTVAVRGASSEIEGACVDRAAEILAAAHSDHPPLPGTVLRQVMGSFVTGVVVAIVKDRAQDAPVGLTASGLVSLSLDPPLIGLSVGVNASSHAAFLQSSQFTISILHAEQSDLAIQLAKSGPDKFRDVDLTQTDDGNWHLTEATATFSCRTRNTLRTGDHTLIVGELFEANVMDQRPGLLFFGGGQFGYPERRPLAGAESRP